jgi:hypothetical protein
MSSEQRIEVYKQHRNAQEKYIYFLLAAAGAAIALALNQTQGAKLAYSQIPLAIAVLLWGLSFLSGCKYLGYMQSTLFANAELLKVEAAEHPLVGGHPQIMKVASQGIREAIESNSTRAGRFARLQFGFLISGAMCYIAWHVFEMWLRS